MRPACSPIYLHAWMPARHASPAEQHSLHSSAANVAWYAPHHCWAACLCTLLGCRDRDAEQQLSAARRQQRQEREERQKALDATWDD